MELAKFERKFHEVDDLVLHLKGRVLTARRWCGASGSG
jgi:hypothetical protein